MNSTTSPSAPQSAPAPRVRLEYLEGLRGLSALYVVLHHIYMDLHFRPAAAGRGDVPGMLLKSLKFLDFGHYAVDIFIVLSGYCLMLPVLTGSGTGLRGGMGGYLLRRARRILPPYYAALLLSLALVPALRFLQARVGLHQEGLAEATAPRVILAHLLLVNNLAPDMRLVTNLPLWSVATEWQIYFFFPALLRLLRRAGIVPTVLAGFALGLAPHFLLHGLFDSAFPWYLGLFALGMAGAVIGFAPTQTALSWKQRVPWGAVAGGLWAALALCGVAKPGWYADHRWAADPAFGLAALCLLVFATEQVRRPETDGRSWPVRLFDSNFSRTLGAFSYSLYLIHFPVVTACGALLVALGLSGVARAGLMFGLVAPLTVGAAYLFYRLFERPFLSGNAGWRRR